MALGIARGLRRLHVAGVQISELWVYPLKGAAGISLQHAELDVFGVRHDRRWMIVDAAGEFVTQRNQPRLALLGTSLASDALELRSSAAGVMRLPLVAPGPSRRTVRIWSDDVEARDCGEDAAAFVSAHLGTEARLLYMPASTRRQIDPAYARPGGRVSFADAFPLLLISQTSLDELNRRLAAPLPMLRFRPNVVVAGAQRPHAEDAWRSVRLGTIVCDVVKPCPRCAVTTVDPATAETGREPLRTLAGYRRFDGQVWFGQNLVHRGLGMLAVGDAVQILDTGALRPPIAEAQR